MGAQIIAAVYRRKTNEELLELAAHREQLTAEASSALTAELTTRRLKSPKPANNELKPRQPRRDKTFDQERDSRHIEVRGFIGEVLRLYHSKSWIFIKLAAPATLVIYLTTTAAQSEVRALTRNVFSHSSASPYRASMALELGLINLARISIIWLVTCLLFAAICSAVDHIKSALVPTFSDCFAEVGHHLGRFVGVSSALLVLLVAFVTMSGFLSFGVFWFARRVQVHLPDLLFSSLMYGPTVAALVMGARFSLAMPAVLLDDYPIGRSILLSDRLTEGKWLILTVLVLKSLIGGYIGAILPFWIRSWLWGTIQLPHWCAVAGSIGAVAMIEPPMFIGFALLYLKVTEKSTTMGSVPRTQFASGPTRTYS